MDDVNGNPSPPEVTLHPWTKSGLDVLRRCNVPDMMRYLGGPETDEQLKARNTKYLRLWESGGARMFQVRIDSVPEAVAIAGYWESLWREQPIYEIGWSTVPEYQGRGIATTAVVAILEYAVLASLPRQVHAFPGVANAPSNAVCRKAGFILTGECEFEYPAGSPMQCNEWVFDLVRADSVCR